MKTAHKSHMVKLENIFLVSFSVYWHSFKTYFKHLLDFLKSFFFHVCLNMDVLFSS